MASVANRTRVQAKTQPNKGSTSNQGSTTQGINTVTLVGNLTQEPELRFVSSGTAVCKFSIAVNRRKFDQETQEFEEVTSFFDVTCWASLAENVAESLDRGTRVLICGRLEQQTWEDSEGSKKSKVVVVADEVAPSLRWASAQVTKNA
jgi:single-strand DNA-binding protein